MTSIQQRDAQTVLVAIDELLPRLRGRAEEADPEYADHPIPDDLDW